MSDAKKFSTAEPRSPAQRGERELYRDIGISAVVAALCVVAKPVAAKEPAGPDAAPAVPAVLFEVASD